MGSNELRSSDSRDDSLRSRLNLHLLDGQLRMMNCRKVLNDLTEMGFERWAATGLFSFQPFPIIIRPVKY